MGRVACMDPVGVKGHGIMFIFVNETSLVIEAGDPILPVLQAMHFIVSA